MWAKVNNGQVERLIKTPVPITLTEEYNKVVTPYQPAIEAVEAVEAQDAVYDDDGNLVSEAVEEVIGVEAQDEVQEVTEVDTRSVNHPASIFNDANRLKESGILPYRFANTVNDRYYYQGQVTTEITEDEVVATIAELPKDVDSLKSSMLAQTRSIASYLLSRDDWMATREFEGGTAIPEDIKAFRAAIREESNAKEIEIASLSTIEDVIAYENKEFTEVRNVKHTAEDGTETYGPETETNIRQINMVTHYEAVDPAAEVDPAFVSIEVV